MDTRNGGNPIPRDYTATFCLRHSLHSTDLGPSVSVALRHDSGPWATDSGSRFWALNYLWPGDEAKLKPAPDALAAKYGAGPTHARFTTVERLVEFRYTEIGIVFVDTPPIQLELIDDDHSHNWEGVARLDDRGFMLMTDKYPETMLGFVPAP